jgi:hypothetical protein
MSFFYTIPGKLQGLSIGAIGNLHRDRVAGWNNRYTNDVNNPGSLTTEDRKYQLVVTSGARKRTKTPTTLLCH